MMAGLIKKAGAFPFLMHFMEPDYKIIQTKQTAFALNSLPFFFSERKGKKKKSAQKSKNNCFFFAKDPMTRLIWTLPQLSQTKINGTVYDFH